MRFFYVAIAETRRDMIEAIVDVINEWNERLKGRVRVGVLVRYTKWRSRRCLPCLLARDRNIPVFVDNGAFSFLSSSDLEGRPDPWVLSRWRVDYAGWLERYWDLYDWAAMPDVPVHGRRFLEGPERLERIRLSTMNQARFLDLVDLFVREKLVPVIQGFTIMEYEESFRRLREFGVLEGTAYETVAGYDGVLAVGSVCVRKWSAGGKTGFLAGGEAAGSLRVFLKGFLEDCCREAWGFHFFGLHRSAVSVFGRHLRFYASDSGAHGLNYKYKWRTILNCKAPNSPDCAAKAVDYQLRRTLTPFLSQPLEVVL